MTRTDPELGRTRKCSCCRQWWPDDADFYRYVAGRLQTNRCKACKRHGPTPARRTRIERTKAWYARLRADVERVRRERGTGREAVA